MPDRKREKTLCPGGKLLKLEGLSLPGEGDPAGEKHGGGQLVPCAVFVVAHQGKTTAGKLYPDLMASAGVETDAHQVLPNA